MAVTYTTAVKTARMTAVRDQIDAGSGAGGTAGEVGSVTLRWQTTQGDTDERTMLFRLAER